MLDQISEIKKTVNDLQKQENQIEQDIRAKNGELHEIHEKLFRARVIHLYLLEIFRLASFHFPRLRKQPNGELTPEDLQELDKWVGRVKSTDGLKSIVDALKEIAKYQAPQIKNVYALVQNIIIEGPNGKRPGKLIK